MKISIKLILSFCILALVICFLPSIFDSHGITYVDKSPGTSKKDLFRVIYKDFTGFIDIDGNPIIKIEKSSPYQYIKNFSSNGLAPVCKMPSQEYRDENCVFINTRGKIAISSEFFNVGSFNDGLAPVKVDSIFSARRHWGYINESGKFVISPKYDSNINGFASDFSEGLATVYIVEDNDGLKYKSGIIDANGKEIVQPTSLFLDIYKFSDGLALFVPSNSPGQYGFLNRKGEIVIPPKYVEVYSFSEGLATVSNSSVPDLNKSSLFFRRDYDGNMSNFKKYGYIDKKGDLAIPFLFDSAFSFSSGLAAVHKDGKCGYINKSGKLEIPNIYQRCKSFSEGLAAVKFQNRWGYIDRSGKLIIPYQFRRAYDFKGGLASVSPPAKYADDAQDSNFYDNYDNAVGVFYINHKGEYVFESKID